MNWLNEMKLRFFEIINYRNLKNSIAKKWSERNYPLNLTLTYLLGANIYKQNYITYGNNVYVNDIVKDEPHLIENGFKAIASEEVSVIIQPIPFYDIWRNTKWNMVLTFVPEKQFEALKIASEVINTDVNNKDPLDTFFQLFKGKL